MEGLAMVYALQKLFHYLLGSHFKLFIDNFTLQYFVNKLALGEKICHWLLLFQKIDLEVIINLGK